MASRNERKRRAKATRAVILTAVEQLKELQEQAFKDEKKRQEFVMPRSDIFDIPKLLRGHREPQMRMGSIVKGRFVSKQASEPAKRKLTLNPVTGKMIERPIRPSGLKTPRK